MNSTTTIMRHASCKTPLPCTRWVCWTYTQIPHKGGASNVTASMCQVWSSSWWWRLTCVLTAHSMERIREERQQAWPTPMCICMGNVFIVEGLTNRQDRRKAQRTPLSTNHTCSCNRWVQMHFQASLSCDASSPGCRKNFHDFLMQSHKVIS